MNMSFFTGAIGANACLKRLSVVSNNLANINTIGFKPKNSIFEELLNYNLNEAREPVTEFQAGASVANARTTTDFYVSSSHATNSDMDYALGDDHTFFMLQDPDTGRITYTRNGHFHAGEMEDGVFYLMTESGKYVLDQNGERLRADAAGVDGIPRMGDTEEEAAAYEESVLDPDRPRIGIYTMSHPSRLLNVGDNEFALRENDQVNVVSLVENPYLQAHAVENSGTDLAREMTRMIETQRAFSYALKMVITSDETEQTVNQLRQ